MTVKENQTESHERDLVRAAQLGDKSAFKTIYDCYRARVYNLALYSLGDRIWAEDALQTIFLKIYRGLPGFRFESTFSTWVYRVALNECLNQQRSRKTQYVSFESILGSTEEFDETASPDLRHGDNQRREIVQQAVSALSPKLRTVVVLKYVEGLSYDEIAAALECSPGTVASRLNRALSKLESSLRPLKRLL
jgi:RNA polymerase sigma-70 factor, ECF subfamily